MRGRQGLRLLLACLGERCQALFAPARSGRAPGRARRPRVFGSLPVSSCSPGAMPRRIARWLRCAAPHRKRRRSGVFALLLEKSIMASSEATGGQNRGSLRSRACSHPPGSQKGLKKQLRSSSTTPPVSMRGREGEAAMRRTSLRGIAGASAGPRPPILVLRGYEAVLRAATDPSTPRPGRAGDRTRASARGV